MNYDTQQYAFFNGLATAPQLHLQQHHLQQQHFQQQQQIFQQQQYNQATPTSNIYQFHFTGGGNHVSPVFQQKDMQPLGVAGDKQSRMAQHSTMVPPFIDQGMPLGGSIHFLSGFDGMVYPQQKNNLKIASNHDGRVFEQPDTSTLRMPQALDMMGALNFVEQTTDQQQHKGISISGQNIFNYNKQSITGWIQQPTFNSSSSAGCQNTLPSFSHVWSHVPNQKQIDIQHQQHQYPQPELAENQLQQPQVLENQIHQSQKQPQMVKNQLQPAHQQPLKLETPLQQPRQQPQLLENSLQQTQQQPQVLEYQLQQAQQPHRQQFIGSAFPLLPGFRMVKLKQPSKRQLTSVPVSSSPLPQHLNGLSLSHPSLASPHLVDKEISDSDRGMHYTERVSTLSPQINNSQPCSSLPSPSYPEQQHSPTAVTYTTSGPPKVTVTLDSLSHNETFPPDNFPSSLTASLNPTSASPNFIPKGRTTNIPVSIITPPALTNCQTLPDQEVSVLRNICPPKSFMHSASTGSLLERSASEGSNFSTPPYTFAPPSSADSVPSPISTHCPKSVTENLACTTSFLSSSSSEVSELSEPAKACVLSWPVSQSSALTAPTFTATLTCTTSSAVVVFSCSTLALTTTSVTSTTPSPKGSSGSASVHFKVPLSSAASFISESHMLSRSPVHKQAVLIQEEGAQRTIKVPYSWHRRCENGMIVYLSPSGEVLQSIDQICHYLLSDSTCKCGLECPIQVEEFFNFDPEVESQPWSAESCGNKLSSLCNRRREILAMAAFHSSQSEAAVNSADQTVELGKKREGRKSIGAVEGLIVSPLKRLKTSIKNAVNKHAMTSGSSLQHVTLPADELSPALNKEQPGHPGTLESAANCKASSDNQCDPHRRRHYKGSPALGRFDFQTHKILDDGERQLPGNKNLLAQADHSNPIFPFQHEACSGSQTYAVNNGPRSFRQAGSNSVFFEEHERESSDTRVQNSYHHVQSSQAQHPLHQPANPAMFYSQNHIFLNMASQQQAYRLHPWQTGSPNNVTPVSIQHHHFTKPCPSDINLEISNVHHPQPSTYTAHGTTNQQTQENQSLMDSKKAKSKRPKGKKGKKKQINSIVDSNSPCLKNVLKTCKTVAVPSTDASFFGNPIVFVEQQAAMINSSIALCQISCPSPPQPVLTKPPITTYSPHKDINIDSKSSRQPESSRVISNVTEDDTDKHENVDEDDDLKAGTDIDSNKSFSDGTENSDSAYLSQTGSDKERSDTPDAIESYAETRLKSCKVFCDKSSEEQASTPLVTYAEDKPLVLSTAIQGSVMSKNIPTIMESSLQDLVPASTKTTQSTEVKSQEIKKTAKTKPKQKVIPAKKEAPIQDVDMLKNFPASLNKELSQLVTSNNWNIPALQQLLAQYNSTDPNQLSAALQQIHSQALSIGADFPASNLLSAAARAKNNSGQKNQAISPLANGLSTPVLQNSKIEALPSLDVSSSFVSEPVTVSVPTAICRSIVSPVAQQQLQTPFHQMGKGSNLFGNLMQFQHLQAGSFAVNMLLSGGGQSQIYPADSPYTGPFNAEAEIQSGQGTVNPLVAPGILGTVKQTGDTNSQIKLSVGQVLQSGNLGGPQCTSDGSTVLLNSFGSRMIMSAPLPPVSVSVVTNVTQSLAQVVPTISMNQPVFSSQQLLGTQPNAPQVISTGAATPGHIINTSPSAPQLVSPVPQSAHFVNPAAQSTQLVSNAPQTQLVNALPIRGLNNQLLIANPMQQVSPQLSPAVAAQFLAQGHQQLPQMSPSFLQKQSPVMNNHNIFASVSLQTLAVTSASMDAVAGSVSQGAIISNSMQKHPSTIDILNNMGLSNSISQVKDATASLINTPMYAAASQPVFVVPQPNTNTVMQLLGSTQPVNATSGLLADLNLQQGNLSQLFGQMTAIDQAQLQNLFTSGFNSLALQQTVNAVSLGDVQQEQQKQLQLLQLQQSMLQLQNQGQNVHGISLNQTSAAGQPAAFGAHTVMNTVMPQQGLHLSSVMDLSPFHPLSPVAQRYQSQLSPAAHVQQISSSLASVHPCGAVGIVHNGNMQNLSQTPRPLQPGKTIQSQTATPSDHNIQTKQNPTVTSSNATSQEPQKIVSSKMQHPGPITTTTLKPSQPSKPRSKSKAKKSENKKVADQETERNEEDIAATVQQILAQAVQQQKELTLAAKNQPPIPTKSKKSQSRSKANQATKEHDLGKLASISDDLSVAKAEESILKDKTLDMLPKCSSSIKSSHYMPAVVENCSRDVQQLTNISVSNVTSSASSLANHQSPHPFNSLGKSSALPESISFINQTLNEANFGNNNAKKTISLKDHLSLIISKDKDGSKKVSCGPNQKHTKGRNNDLKINHTSQAASVPSADFPMPSKTHRKYIK